MKASTKEASLQAGQELLLEIYALAYGGEGIAKHQGLVVFVPEALPGDHILARVTQVKKKFARAEILEVRQSATDRVQPFCPLSGTCGGCSWQHLNYEAQLAAKHGFVENTLLHLGHLKPATVLPILRAAPQTGYRHKIQIPLQAGPAGVRAGFYAKQTHEVVSFEDCPIQPPLGNRLARQVRDLIREYGYSGYDEARHSGQFRHLVLRLALHTHAALCTLVTVSAEVPRLAEFAAELRRRVPETTGVLQNVNPDRTNVILGTETRLLSGQGCLYEEVRGLRYRISAESFFQVNPFQLPALADAVLLAAGVSGRETVVDLFCGVGWLTLELARRSRMVFGVETARTAVEDARANVHLNQMSNAEFFQADAADGVRALQAKGLQPDVVILDPPRKGCDPKLLALLLAWRPKRIVYVSCNPVTLARDLARLAPAHYQVQSVQPIDLFPHTYHVESVAALIKK